MKLLWKFAYLLVFLQLGTTLDSNVEEEEIKARDFLLILGKEFAERNNKAINSEWEYITNLTDYNLQKKLAVANEVAVLNKETWKQIQTFNWQTFSDPVIRRQFKLYSVLGIEALPKDDLTKFNNIVGEMSKIYSTAKICDFEDSSKCDLSLEPELTNILAKSRNEPELKHIWINWRNAVGPHVKHMYKDYVYLSNKAATLNNFKNNAEMWLDQNYEDLSIGNEIQLLWDQIRPLYQQIHAYTRYQLRKHYGDVVSEKGPIPAHLLGNMWSQSWENIAASHLPYPEKKDVDITAKLREQNYTVDKIFKTAEEFFTSIDLSPMPQSFWEKSIFEKPKDREIICHASALDFFDAKDFRIKQCTEVTGMFFLVTHHEMGHIEYFLQYKNQPPRFRQGANSGFHEAIGDLIALSVKSNKHLRKLGLLDSEKDDLKTTINSLFMIGMEKIVFLPFAYIMDLWRWNIFAGNTTSENYNCKWWELREKYQGIEPPVDRSEEDFDPASKYHIVADVEYVRYFVSFVIQFQFHRALCEKAGEYDPYNSSKPLHECDIYQNKEAGHVLKKMLELGASKPWPEAFELVTGQKFMDASGLLEYFKPLRKWLEEENKKNDAFIGWEKSTKTCTTNKTTAAAPA